MTRGGFGASSDGDPIFFENFFRLSFGNFFRVSVSGVEAGRKEGRQE